MHIMEIEQINEIGELAKQLFAQLNDLRRFL